MLLVLQDSLDPGNFFWYSVTEYFLLFFICLAFHRSLVLDPALVLNLTCP